MIDAAKTQWNALEFHQGDRMGKALDFANVTAKDMASYLEVDAATVSRWVNGKQNPSKQTMRLWALRTGVPLEWLETGDVTHARPTPVGPTGIEPMTSTVECGRLATVTNIFEKVA